MHDEKVGPCRRWNTKCLKTQWLFHLFKTKCTNTKILVWAAGLKWADINKPQCAHFGKIIEAKSPITNDLVCLQQQDWGKLCFLLTSSSGQRRMIDQQETPSTSHRGPTHRRGTETCDQHPADKFNECLLCKQIADNNLRNKCWGNMKKTSDMFMVITSYLTPESQADIIDLFKEY